MKLITKSCKTSFPCIENYFTVKNFDGSFRRISANLVNEGGIPVSVVPMFTCPHQAHVFCLEDSCKVSSIQFESLPPFFALVDAVYCDVVEGETFYDGTIYSF